MIRNRAGVRKVLKKLGLDRAGGFTLIEVFLVTTLLSIVFFTIISVHTSGIKIWKSVGNRRFTEDRKVFLAIEKIRKEITGYIRDFKEIEFTGDKESLTFPAVVGGKIVEVTYEFDKGKDVLIREVVKFTDSLKEKMKKNKTSLLEADKVEFSYLYSETAKGAGGWANSYSSEENNELEAVKLIIRRNKKTVEKTIFIPS